MKFALSEPVQAHRALDTAWQRIKPLLMAGHRLVLTVKPETRNDAQNALLHAILTEIAQTRDWAGQRRSVEVWKRLLTAAWLRARGDAVEILPAIDGHGIDVVYARTSKLTKAECAELVEFIEAWRATT